ncbi:MAG: pilus assembly protein PilM, partial [Salinibacterium sp.]|nr:pilus assembly protein PilM [Salinibacterium sp.]
MADFPAWGIHLTTSSLRGIKLERAEDGEKIRVVAHDQIDFAEDIEDVTSLDRHGPLLHALAVFSKRHDLQKCRVIVSVDGATAFNRFVSAPLVQGESLARILAFEAQQQIPFDLEEVYWDYKSLDVRQE